MGAPNQMNLFQQQQQPQTNQTGFGNAPMLNNQNTLSRFKY